MGGGPVASGNIRQVGWEDTADDIKKEQGLVLMSLLQFDSYSCS